MPEDFKYDVFLSHSSKDKAVVRPVAERLKRDGLKVWFDEWVLKPGDNVPKKIDDGLDDSRVLVFCMSANAFGSDWAQLESHTFRFRDPLNKDRRFIPLRLDDAPIKGSLAQFLYIKWHPPDREQEYAKLLEACQPPQMDQTATTQATEGASLVETKLDVKLESAGVNEPSSMSIPTSNVIESPGDPNRRLTRLEINKLVNRYIGVSSGYLADFSYRTHHDFYLDLDLDIDPHNYGGTTRERFIKILCESPPSVQARILEGILTRFPVGSSELRTQERRDEIAGWIGRLNGIAMPDSSFFSQQTSRMPRSLKQWWADMVSGSEEIGLGDRQDRSMLIDAAPTVAGYRAVELEIDRSTPDPARTLEPIDSPAWDKARTELIRKKCSGKCAQVIYLESELSESPLRLGYRVIDYVDAQAFHEMIKNDPGAWKKYADVARGIKKSGTSHFNILSVAVIAIVGNDHAQVLICQRPTRRTGSDHASSPNWAVSIGEIFKPVADDWISTPDTSLCGCAQRGLREELLGDYFEGPWSFSIQAFAMDDCLDFFPIVVADLRQLSFTQLAKLWPKSRDSGEQCAIGALSASLVRKCLGKRYLPREVLTEMRSLGWLTDQHGVSPSLADACIWQPGSDLRLGVALWYLENYRAS